MGCRTASRISLKNREKIESEQRQEKNLMDCFWWDKSVSIRKNRVAKGTNKEQSENRAKSARFAPMLLKARLESDDRTDLERSRVGISH